MDDIAFETACAVAGLSTGAVFGSKLVVSCTTPGASVVALGIAAFAGVILPVDSCEIDVMNSSAVPDASGEFVARSAVSSMPLLPVTTANPEVWPILPSVEMFPCT